MRCIRMIMFFTLMSLLLSACGDSGGSHHGSWESATLVADNAGGPDLVSDRNGNLIAVWIQYNNTDPDGVYFNYYNARTGWGVPQKIADYVWDFRISLSPNGQLAAIWCNDRTLDEFEIKIVEINGGTGFSLVENLSEHGFIADLAIDNAGNIFATQVHPTSTFKPELILARFNKTDGWSHDRIDPGGDSIHIGEDSKIALDDSGNGFVIWSNYSDTYSPTLFATRFSRAALGETIQLVEQSITNFYSINIAMDNNGNALALWTAAEPPLNIAHIYACHYSIVNGWGMVERIDNNPLGAFGQFIAVDPAGNFHAIWCRVKGRKTSDIYSCKFTPSGGWQTPVFVGSGGGVEALYPKIAADNRGNLFAAWQQYDPDAPSGFRFPGVGKVYANYSHKGTKWGLEQQLSIAPGNARNPSLAVDQSGGVMVIWYQTTESVEGILSHGVFSSRFR